MKKMGEETRGGRGRRHFLGCGDADGGVLRSAVRQSAGFGGAAGNAAGPGAGSAGDGAGAGAAASGGHGAGEVSSADPGACLSREESLLQYITHRWRNRRLKRSACI